MTSSVVLTPLVLFYLKTSIKNFHAKTLIINNSVKNESILSFLTVIDLLKATYHFCSKIIEKFDGLIGLMV